MKKTFDWSHYVNNLSIWIFIDRKRLFTDYIYYQNNLSSMANLESVAKWEERREKHFLTTLSSFCYLKNYKNNKKKKIKIETKSKKQLIYQLNVILVTAEHFASLEWFCRTNQHHHERSRIPSPMLLSTPLTSRWRRFQMNGAADSNTTAANTVIAKDPI